MRQHVKIARVVLVLAVVGAVLLATTHRASSGPPQAYGFNDLVWNNPAVSHELAKREFAKAGASYWRLPLSWQYFEPKKGVIDPTFLPTYMDAYQQMIANGQTPVFIVQGTPYWALTDEGRGKGKGSFYCGDNNNATVCTAPPDVRDPEIMASWQLFVQIMSYFMPLAVFEIWNEPNIDWFWLQSQDPELYGLMLKSAGEAIHSVSPATRVLAASTSTYDGPDTPENTGFRSFIQRMYTVAEPSSFDGIGMHVYPCNFTPTEAGWTQIPAIVLDAMRSARDAAGDHDKPLWLTETGATTGAPASANCDTRFTEEQQGKAIAAVLEWARRENDAHRDIPVVLIHSLFNSHPRTNIGESSGSGEGEYGLIAYTTGQPVQPDPDSDDPATADGPAQAPTVAAKPGLAAVKCAIKDSCGS